MVAVTVNEAASASGALAALVAAAKEGFPGARAGGYLVFARTSSHAEEDGGKQEADESCPFEAKGIFTDIRGLTVISEVVTSFDVRSAVAC